jgi:WD40 repeat protein/tRNA A-37 threonylcarbamoyl transferase component Bud32
MSYCINPSCTEPQNLDTALQCQACGAPLRLQSRYRPIRLLGQGGFGRTFLAVDEAIDASVDPQSDNAIDAAGNPATDAEAIAQNHLNAPELSSPLCVIKQISPHQPEDHARTIARFRQEAQWLTDLGHHPQIPRLLASFEQDGRFYLVQTYIVGKSLADELTDQGAFGEAQIWQILDDLLPVIQFIHQHQVIHRDIKPENLIRCPDGRLVLVDFGAAKVMASDRTPVDTHIGSPEYVAPEQARGKACYASDLYSLGVTCIHLLTQVRPFDLFDVATDRWVWQHYLTQSVSDRLAQLLDKLIQNPVNQRFQTADEVIRAIGPLKPKQDSSPEKESPPLAASPPSPIIRHAIARLSAHTASVNAIALHPTERILASASDDRTICLWDLTTEQPLATLTGHSNSVQSVAFSRDGSILASSSDDKTIKLWNWQRSTEIATLSGHTAAVKSVCFIPQGKWLASGSWDKTIKLWQVETGKTVLTLKGHGLQVTAIALSPDGKMLASASCDRTLRLWHLDSDEDNLETDLISAQISTAAPSTVLKGHTRAVSAVAFSPDGKLLAAGSSDNTVTLWQVETGQCLRTLMGHSWTVSAVAFSPDGKTLLSASWDKTIKLWQVSSGQELETLVGHSDSVNSIVVDEAVINLAMVNLAMVNDAASLLHQSDPSSPGYRVISGSRDTTIQVWQCTRSH